MSQATCAERKPGFKLRPPIANSLPCVLPADHDSNHRNVTGRAWPNSHGTAAELGGRTRVAVDLAASAEEDPRARDLLALQAQASRLWARVLAGEDTPYLRAHIGRLESLQAAFLMGDPSLVACCSCGRPPAASAA